MSALVKTKTPGIYKRGSRYVVTFRDQCGVPRKRSAALKRRAKPGIRVDTALQCAPPRARAQWP